MAVKKKKRIPAKKSKKGASTKKRRAKSKKTEKKSRLEKAYNAMLKAREENKEQTLLNSTKDADELTAILQKSELSVRAENFCREYAMIGSVQVAAERAGYTMAGAYNLRMSAQVQARIAELRMAFAAQWKQTFFDAHAHMAMNNIMMMSDANIANYVVQTEHGLMLDLDKLRNDGVKIKKLTVNDKGFTIEIPDPSRSAEFVAKSAGIGGSNVFELPEGATIRVENREHDYERDQGALPDGSM